MGITFQSHVKRFFTLFFIFLANAHKISKDLVFALKVHTFKKVSSWCHNCPPHRLCWTTVLVLSNSVKKHKNSHQYYTWKTPPPCIVLPKPVPVFYLCRVIQAVKLRPGVSFEIASRCGGIRSVMCDMTASVFSVACSTMLPLTHLSIWICDLGETIMPLPSISVRGTALTLSLLCPLTVKKGLFYFFNWTGNQSTVSWDPRSRYLVKYKDNNKKSPITYWHCYSKFVMATGRFPWRHNIFLWLNYHFFSLGTRRYFYPCLCMPVCSFTANTTNTFYWNFQKVTTECIHLQLIILESTQFKIDTRANLY